MTDETEKTYRILKSDQRWFVTLPKVLAQSLGFKAGDTIEWKIDRGDLILKKVKE